MRRKTVGVQDFQRIIQRLRSRSPAGFAIGLHLRFTTPRYFLHAYEPEWLDLYSAEGLVMQDPTVRWSFLNTGTIRWSDLAAEDHAGVLAKAAQFGMIYGVTVALADRGSRSMASFARSDREHSDLDIHALETDLRALHLQTLTMELASPALHEMLTQLSIYLTRG